MSINTQPYKGARDFYPEDKRLQKWLFANWREVCERFGYEEYDAPILEPTDLFLMKGNAEIIQEQTYTFEDRGGRSVTVRTEMTPSVSRMVAARRQELNYPLRWYSIPNCWRYERPQRGRGREFYQLNVDLFGEAGIAAEHEMILMSDALMQVFGAKRAQYTIRINSRAFVDYMLGEYFKLNKDQSNTVRRLIDRMSKMPLTEFATKLDACLDETQRKHGVGDKILKVLQVKSVNELPDALKNSETLQPLQELMLQLARDGITNALFDISLMRGFDYYTGIVFEVFDTNPENSRSLFGGGRYDGLVSEFGVDPVPTIGFAVGDITMTDFLQTHQMIPKLEPETDLAVILIGDVFERAQPLLKELRDAGIRVYVDATGRRLEKKLKNAINKVFEAALFVGEAELAAEQFRLKNLKNQVEQKLSIVGVVSALKASKK